MKPEFASIVDLFAELSSIEDTSNDPRVMSKEEFDSCEDKYSLFIVASVHTIVTLSKRKELFRNGAFGSNLELRKEMKFLKWFGEEGEEFMEEIFSSDF